MSDILGDCGCCCPECGNCDCLDEFLECDPLWQLEITNAEYYLFGVWNPISDITVDMIRSTASGSIGENFCAATTNENGYANLSTGDTAVISEANGDFVMNEFGPARFSAYCSHNNCEDPVWAIYFELSGASTSGTPGGSVGNSSYDPQPSVECDPDFELTFHFDNSAQFPGGTGQQVRFDGRITCG